MATNNFTTRTASLRATKIDTSKIILKGKNILDYISESKTKVLDDRGDFVTDQDLWGTSVTTDANGVVHVSHKFINNPNDEAAWNSSVKSVKDNKAYTSADASGEPLCNIQTEMIKDGSRMFYCTSLASFSGDLSSLVKGSQMFSYTSLTSFSGDLSSLVNGYCMFGYNTSLTSFNGDLSNLVNGTGMFTTTSLTSFSSDLSSLVNGSEMFSKTKLTSFSGDLSNLVNGSRMFSKTKLTSFSGDLGSLQTGYAMFGDGSNVTYTNEEGVTETTKNITPLDEQSVMIIADTIKDLNGFTDWDTSITSSRRGKIHIGYDSTVCDAATIEEYCTEIMNKGWTVYLNGTVQTATEGIEGVATLAEDGSITSAPIPYYCKPLEVEQKEANWTDGEKYYIILGAQKVFGDDLSTYGLFTSIENAAMNMGFTSYKYVEEEEEVQA